MDTEIDSENLIALVLTRKALWDKTLKQYRNRLMVDKLWRQVSCELGGEATTDAVKKRWKNLRTSFAKEMKKIPEGRSGDAGPSNYGTYTSWPFFESMLFLKDQVKPRKSGSNLSAGGGGNENDVDDEDLHESVSETIPEEPTDNADAYEVAPAAEIIPHPNPQPRNRAGKRGVQQQLIDIEARKLRLLEKKANKSSACDDDEDEAFFKSLLPHVKKLKPREKLEFRMEMQSLVHKLVYKDNRTQDDPNVYNIQSSTPLQSHAPFAEFEMNASQTSCSHQ
ncbi:uncharacterized protein LOC135701461, partial [Ochlerotatus camptorhynchus]|uniref:uncharacterized protein LOC135701461 n=1 Tax=Ochlerotatus camptorhynchus TaxID=644619 RepID=UPI0031DD0303